MDSEKRISDILNSFDGMQKAEPSPYLYAKIQTRLNSISIQKTPFKWTVVTLASLTILFLINISLVNFSDTNSNETNEFISTQQEMNSEQLY
jgi:hypothetical protein